MVFTHEDRVLIKCLRESKGYSARRFLKEFPDKNWKVGGLNKLIRKIDSFGTINHLPGAGRPRSVRNVENIAAVAELVLSHGGQSQTHRTQIQIPVETGIKRTGVQSTRHLRLKRL